MLDIYFCLLLNSTRGYLVGIQRVPSRYTGVPNIMHSGVHNSPRAAGPSMRSVRTTIGQMVHGVSRPNTLDLGLSFGFMDNKGSGNATHDPYP